MASLEGVDVSRLKLKRPLVIFDLETTGTDVATDRIIEIAMIRIDPDGTVTRKPEARGPEHRLLVHPERPIPL
jgi:DNA polymerase-3 subunit epsilon